MNGGKMIPIRTSIQITRPRAFENGAKLKYSVVAYKSSQRILWFHERKLIISRFDGTCIFEHNAQFVIKQAFIHNFTDKTETSPLKIADQETICVVGETRIEFLMLTDHYHYTLPFEIEKVFSTPIGLIIERVSENNDATPMMPANLYSVIHPLGVILPLILNKKDFSNEWYYAFEQEGFQVIGTEKDLMVVYDPMQEAHIIYRIREVESGFWNTIQPVEKKRSIPSTSRRFLLTPDRANSASAKLAFHTPGSGTKTPGKGAEEWTSWEFIHLFNQKRFTPQYGAGTPLSTAGSKVLSESITGHSSINSARWPPFFDPLSELDDSDMDKDESFIKELNTADLYLELIFTEKAVDPMMRCSAAEKIFVTSDIVGREYFAFLIPTTDEQYELRMYALAELCSGRISMETILCKDAGTLAEVGFMLVLDLHSNLQLYSGLKRLCLVALCKEEPLQGQITLITKDVNGFFWTGRTNEDMHFCNFPTTFQNLFVQQIWDTIIQAVPQDKAFIMITELRGTFTPSINIDEELQRLFYFLGQQLGVKFDEHFWAFDLNMDLLSGSDRFTKAETAVKIPRPPHNLDEVAKWVLNYNVDITQRPTPTTIKYDVQQECLLNNEVYCLLARLHSIYETCSLFKEKPSGFAIFTRILYSINRAFQCNERVKIYLEDMHELKKIKLIRDSPTEIFPACDQSGEELTLYLPNQIATLLCSKVAPKLPDGISIEVAIVLLALATGYSQVNTPGELRLFIGKSRRFFNEPSISDDSLIQEFLSKQGSLERLEFLFAKYPGILNFGKLSPMITYLLKARLLFLSEGGQLWLNKDLSNSSPHRISSIDQGRLICRYRWPHDIRLCNVESFLDNSRPTFIPKRHDQNDSESRELYDQFVLTIAIRTMTLPFGIAALKLRSLNSYIDQTFTIPEICFSGRSFPENRPIELTVADGLRSVRDWGEFYNGVATGLSIRASDEHQISGEWIQNILSEHNKSITSGTQTGNEKNGKPSPASAGLLLGLGLNQHLPMLNIYNAHQMLAAQDKFTSIALLLGYGASKVGTGDEQVHRILVTHISFMMGPTLLEVNIDSCVQAAAISALGLLFAQKGTSTMINQLINEMGKALHSESEPSYERYAYILSIGMAIGLAGLGKGPQYVPRVPIAESRPGLIERLLILMEGGPRARAVFNVESSTDQMGPFDEPQTFSQSNHCREIPTRLNLHSTGHPATIALGLLFMKTHNKTVEFLLRIPNTLPEIEKIRADVVPVRIMARALVMWNEIKPTKEWIYSQIPKIVLDTVNNAIGVNTPNRVFSSDEEDYWDTVVDRETAAQAYIHCISAACFMVSLKYASTCLPKIKKLFIDLILMLIPADSTPPSYTRLIRLAEKGAVAVSQNLLTSALGILMAGSGDVEVLRLCHYMRRADPVGNWYKNVYTHSVQSAIHTTLGLLFLGNARYSFGRSDIAIASLVIAFYPIVGHHAGDHRLYLQPLHFLWVLAVERRLIYTVDSKGRQRMCRASVRIRMKTAPGKKEKWINNVTPCLLPPLCEIDLVIVGGGSFETRKFRGAALDQLLQRENGCIKLNSTSLQSLRLTIRGPLRRVTAKELQLATPWKWKSKTQNPLAGWKATRACLNRARAEADCLDDQGFLTDTVAELYNAASKSKQGLLKARDIRIAETFLAVDKGDSAPAQFVQKLVSESKKLIEEESDEVVSLSQPLSPFHGQEPVFQWRYV